MITENNLINWLRFIGKIIPNKEDKKCITRYLNNHTDKRDNNTGTNKYTSRKLYHKFWDCK